MKKVGRYVIDKRIGEGAMADVFRAHDPSIDRVLAIKILKPEFRMDEGLTARFLREAKAAGALSHAHIVTIYDVGEADGYPYIAMELLDGVPLDEQLRDHGRMALADAVRVGIEIAGALDYAHGLGVIHRDIKPSNIMLCRNGAAKILDFGIARIDEERSRADTNAARTQIGQVIGTPRYMSPEQAFGLELDNRSDLFSLGVVLYELITGVTAFTGTSLATLALQITQHKPEPIAKMLPGCPRGIQYVIDKLLAKQADKRFANGAAVADALRREAEALNAPKESRRGLSMQLRLTAVMTLVVGIALVLSIATVLDRQVKAMEHMAVTSGTAMAGFVANNVALRAVENAGLASGEQDWLPVQAFIATAARDSGVKSIVMVDSSGTIRGATDPSQVGRRFGLVSGERRMSAGTDQLVTATAANDFRFLRTIRYAGRPFGGIEVVVDGGPLQTAAQDSRRLLAGLGGLLMLVVVALSFGIGQIVARPVDRLLRSLRDAAAGRRDFRISHRRKDEFGDLYDAFNDLAESLEPAEEEEPAPEPIHLESTRIDPAPAPAPKLRKAG